MRFIHTEKHCLSQNASVIGGSGSDGFLLVTSTGLDATSAATSTLQITAPVDGSKPTLLLFPTTNTAMNVIKFLRLKIRGASSVEFIITRTGHADVIHGPLAVCVSN